MSKKCQEHCPHCAETVERGGEGYHRVYLKRQEPHKGLPQCERHGCVLVEGEWSFECHKCGERTDKLYGYFVPYLCKTCFDAIVAHQRATGDICGMCGQVHIMCCC